jgi:parallel beta-helix repeat protein
MGRRGKWYCIGSYCVQSNSRRYNHSDNIHTNDGINLEGADYIVIDGFTITNQGGSITRAGIRSVTNTGVVIRNNTIDGMGTWGIFTGFSYNILIENNHCSNSQDEHGIYFSNSGDNPVIRGNICHHNNGCGIHMNGDIGEGGDGIISNALVEGNIIYENGNDGGSGITATVFNIQSSEIICFIITMQAVYRYTRSMAANRPMITRSSTIPL